MDELEAFCKLTGLTVEKIYKMRNEVLEKGLIPDKLILPQPNIMGLRIEFCPMASKPYVLAKPYAHD